MAKLKDATIIVETHDYIGIGDAFGIIQEALKEISTEAEILDGNVIEWDVSKNVPGYSVKLRDEGVDKPRRIIVGKAKKKGKATTEK